MQDRTTPTILTYMHPAIDIPLNIWFPPNSRTGSIHLRQVYTLSTEKDVHRQTYYLTNGTA